MSRPPPITCDASNRAVNTACVGWRTLPRRSTIVFAPVRSNDFEFALLAIVFAFLFLRAGSSAHGRVTSRAPRKPLVRTDRPRDRKELPAPALSARSRGNLRVPSAPRRAKSGPPEQLVERSARRRLEGSARSVESDRFLPDRFLPDVSAGSFGTRLPGGMCGSGRRK